VLDESGNRERLGEEPEPAVAWVDQTVWPTTVKSKLVSKRSARKA